MDEKQRQKIISELKDFYKKLRSYDNRQHRSRKVKLSEAQIRSLNALRLKLQRDYGRLANTIYQYGGDAYVTILGRDYEVFDCALGSLDMHHGEFRALDGAISMVNKAIGKLESDIQMGKRDEQGDLIEKTQGVSNIEKSPIHLFDKMQFHPKIVNASRALFEDEHYAQAIFEAFKAVENFVQDKSGLTLYGTNLMDTVFNEENPIIKVPEAGHYYKDVQRGFKHLFVGAAQAIRNPKAHKEIIQKDPYITLQYLGFFSFLLKRIDYWDAGVS